MKFKNDYKGADLLAANKQWDELSQARLHAIDVSNELIAKTGFLANDERITTNMGRISEMYRVIDGEAVGEDRGWGSQGLLGQLIATATPVSIGAKVVESRRYSEAGRVERSMSGNVDIVIDKTDSNYQKMIIPTSHAGYGRDFREVAALQDGMIPALAEDAQEVEFALLEDANDALWNGYTDISVDGVTWGGLKSDSSIATYTLAADLTVADEKAVIAELLALLNVLRINNKQTGVRFKLMVSARIMSNMQSLAQSNTNGFANTLAAVRALLPEFETIEADDKLQGNQVFATHLGSRGLHAKSGMALSSYQLPRFKHNDPYTFVKWMALGFQSKVSYSGLKASVYGS